jgi:hypothetical protein
MKQTLLFLAKFVALTAPLTWLWQVWGRRAYAAFYGPVAHSIYSLLGFDRVPIWSRERFINYIPFLTLMILTPGLSPRRRLVGTALGMVALFFFHIATNLMHAPGSRSLPIGVKLALDAAPFLLWVLIAHQFVRELARRKPSPGPSPSGAPRGFDRGPPPDAQTGILTRPCDISVR